MGQAIPSRRFDSRALYSRPIVYCRKLRDVSDDAVALNVRLARLLSGRIVTEISIKLEELFLEAIADLPDDVVVSDFDVLFNPAYKVDLLRMFASAYRKKHFDVLWPGSFDGQQLVYAEEGFADFRTYDISQYDITCVY